MVPHPPNVDLPALLASLREERPSPERLRGLLDRGSPALTHAVLAHIERRLRDGAILDVAALLPADLPALPPETQALFAGVYRLVPPDVPLPDWRATAPPLAAEVAWLQTELLRSADTVSICPYPLLHAALAGLDWQAVPDPERLLAALAARPEPSIRELACAQVECCLCAGALLPATAREFLLGLLDSPDPPFEAVLLRLGQPWAACFACPAKAVAPLLDRGGGVARAALDVLARWPGAAARLAAVLTDDGRDCTLRRHALGLLGPLGGAEHVDVVLDVAASDPLFFGAAALACLRDLTRRGVPWSAVAIDPLFSLFLRCPALSVADTAEVVGPRWPQWLAALEGLPPADPSWLRQLDLLERAARPEATAYLLGLLARADFVPQHPAVLAALGRLGCRAAEPRALALLDREPEAAAFALERVGGAATCRALGQRLARSELSPLPRAVALRLLLALSERTELVLDLVTPEELGPEFIARLGTAAGERTLEVLTELAHRPGHPARLRAIEQLGTVGGADALPALHELFLGDEEIRAAARAAARAIGRRLYALGKARPVCLLDARGADEAAEYTEADALLEALDRPGLTEDRAALLLEQLSEGHHPRLAVRVLPWLRRAGPHVQKHVLRCLGRTGDAHLSPWLLPFAAGSDLFTARPALEALGRMNATWAASVLAAALDHPNMNIKKTAAEALRGAGGPAVVPALLRWLATHDNPGLRANLVEALRAILGRAYVATVLAALSNVGEPRAVELLLTALDGHLSRAAVVQVVRQGAAWSGILLERLRAGTLCLISGDWPALERELQRRGLADAVPGHGKHAPDGAVETALEALAGDKDALERALVVLRDATLTAVHVRVLRGRLPGLLGRLADAGDGTRRALLGLLERLVDQIEEPERVAVAFALRQVPLRDRLPLDQVLRLLRRCAVVLAPDEARLALALPERDPGAWALGQLLNAGALAAEELTELLVAPRWVEQREALLEYGLRFGLEVPLLAAAVESSPPWLRALRRRWPARTDSATADLLLGTLRHCPEAARGELLTWLADLDDERIDGLFLKDLGSANPDDSERAVARLRQRPAQTLGETLAGLLGAPQQSARRAAARVLLSWPGSPHREQVLEAALRGNLGGPLPELRFESRDLARAQAADGEDAVVARLAELIGQAAAPPREKAVALLALWRRPSDEGREAVRLALRTLPVEQVLPLLLPDLEAGRWRVVDLLGNTTQVDGLLVRLLRSGDERTVAALLGLLERWSGAGPLTGPDLTAALVEVVARHPVAAAFLGRLGDWATPKGMRVLMGCLEKLLVREDVARLAVAALLEGLRAVPPEAQVRALSAVRTESARPALVARLAELQGEAPAATAALSPAWREAVRQHLLGLARGRAPEPARQALETLAEEGDELLPELLEEALGHPHARVRVLAHRLLRQAVPPERYLEATRRLLHDRVPELRRTAVRTLAFRGHVAAAREIALLLHDREKGLDRVARTGLLALGPAALPALRRLLAHARPDRRAPLQEVIGVLESQASGADTPVLAWQGNRTDNRS